MSGAMRFVALERALQIFDDFIRVLEPHRHSDQAVVDPRAQPRLA